MKEMSLEEAACALGGTLIGWAGRTVKGVSIDSRSVKTGDLFFALKGSRHDGHAYVERALAKGAVAAVVSHLPEGVSGPLLLVGEVREALQRLAERVVAESRVPVVAVTGSTGKTTTKDLINGVLGVQFNVLKTEGNQNNELGLPLTLLKLEPCHQMVVVEMAMRGAGEIAALCRIAHPRVGVITNIGLTHLERLGSQQAIAQAKWELIDSLPGDGWAVLNGDDPWLCRFASSYRGRVINYGLGRENQVRAESIVGYGLDGIGFRLITPGGEADCRIALPGEHNVSDALAAAAVGHCFGLKPEQIAYGLAQARMTGRRVEIKNAPGGIKIIDDTYNASPASTVAALRLMAGVTDRKRKVAVLGDMFELGAAALPGHREVGRTVAELGIDYLITLGELSRETTAAALAAGMTADRVKSFDNQVALTIYLRRILKRGDLVLVKGSRGMEMNLIVSALVEEV